jgi:hypothetical protein
MKKWAVDVDYETKGTITVMVRANDRTEAAAKARTKAARVLETPDTLHPMPKQRVKRLAATSVEPE